MIQRYSDHAANERTFLAWVNALLRFFVNNTFNGILDADTDSGLIVGGGPMALDFEGTVTFDAAATPLPAALPLFAGGLGAMGLLGWRRKRKA